MRAGQQSGKQAPSSHAPHTQVCPTPTHSPPPLTTVQYVCILHMGDARGPKGQSGADEGAGNVASLATVTGDEKGRGLRGEVVRHGPRVQPHRFTTTPCHALATNINTYA